MDEEVDGEHTEVTEAVRKIVDTEDPVPPRRKTAIYIPVQLLLYDKMDRSGHVPCK
jgi:hypothetical protein